MRKASVGMGRQWSAKFIDDNEFRYMQDDFLVNPIRCKVGRTSNYSVASTSTMTNLPWQTEIYAEPSGWWSSGDATKVYLPYDGYYVAELDYGWADGSWTGVRRCLVYFNDPSQYAEEYRNQVINYWTYGTITKPSNAEVKAGTYVYVRLWTNVKTNDPFNSASTLTIVRMGV